MVQHKELAIDTANSCNEKTVILTKGVRHSSPTDVFHFIPKSVGVSCRYKDEMPFREDKRTDFQLSPYAASKKGAESFAYTYHYLYGIDITIPRYYTAYGPAGRPDMSVFKFIRRIAEGLPILVYGDGSQERDFTYIDDIARGSIAALKPREIEEKLISRGKPLGFEVINLPFREPGSENNDATVGKCNYLQDFS